LQLFSPTGTNCDKFGGVPPHPSNSLQLFSPTGTNCDKFGGVPPHPSNSLQLFSPTGNNCDKFGGCQRRGSRRTTSPSPVAMWPVRVRSSWRMRQESSRAAHSASTGA